jgi:hypothetical protein
MKVTYIHTIAGTNRKHGGDNLLFRCLCISIPTVCSEACIAALDSMYNIHGIHIDEVHHLRGKFPRTQQGVILISSMSKVKDKTKEQNI